MESHAGRVAKTKNECDQCMDHPQVKMGTPDAVSRYVSEFKAKGANLKLNFTELTTKVMT